MNVKGMMIGVRRYQFTDKETGELVRGAKVQVGVSPEDDNTAGFVVQDIPASFELYPSLSTSAKQLVGKQVEVVCDVTLRGRYTKLRASSIQAA